jgi:hypothetical protein
MEDDGQALQQPSWQRAQQPPETPAVVFGNAAEVGHPPPLRPSFELPAAARLPRLGTREERGDAAAAAAAARPTEAAPADDGAPAAEGSAGSTCSWIGARCRIVVSCVCCCMLRSGWWEGIVNDAHWFEQPEPSGVLGALS